MLIMTDTSRSGVTATREHGEDAARHLELSLERLIAVGVDAERDRFADVARLAELLLENRHRIGLVEELRLEVQPRREPEKGMARPRETVHAPVAAAAVGVDRLLESDVGRIVGGDDPTRTVRQYRLGEKIGRFLLVPSIIALFDRQRVESARGIGRRAPALEWL
jgi:hypothetical protein